MKLRSFWHFDRISFFLLDYFLLWCAIVCAFELSPRYPLDVLDGLWLRPEVNFIGYAMPFFMALGLQVTGVQRSQSGFRGVETLVQTLTGLVAGVTIFVLIHVLVEYSLIGRYVLGFSLVYGTAFIVGSRLMVWKLAERSSRSVIVYGDKTAFEAIERTIRAARLPVRVLGYTQLGKTGSAAKIDGFLSANDLGLSGLCEKNAVEEMIVEVPDALERGEREALLLCTRMGINVIEMNYFFERNLERVYVPGLREAWFWGYDPGYAHFFFFAFKRFTDILVSLLGIALFTPLLPFIVILIKFQDGGSVIYSQLRVGLNNQSFRIFKFRTMRMDAEKGGAQWATANDQRTTPLGRVLRRTRLDEVPQFWNILKGEMSFIGPRPERPEFVDMIEREVPFYRYRHLIKPGLTGWAQINYRYGASVDEAKQKLSYDLYYLKYASAMLDMLIIFRTAAVMAKGAR